MRKLPIRHTDKEQRASNPHIPFTVGLRAQATCHSGPTLQWQVFRQITGGFCLLLLVLWLPLRTAYAAGPATIDPRTLTFKAIEFVQPEPDRVVLENGMVIYLLEDHELPLITIGVLMRT